MRALARNAALLLFGAVGAYLLGAMIAARLALALTDVGGGSVWLRVLLGVLALDLSKLPALLLAAWLVSAVASMRPMPMAIALVGLTYTLELLMGLMLSQHGWLWGSAAVLACRAAAASVLVYAVARFARWRIAGRRSEGRGAVEDGGQQSPTAPSRAKNGDEAKMDGP